MGSVGNGAQPYLWQPDGTGQALPTPAGKPGGVAMEMAGDRAAGRVDYLAGAVVGPNGRVASGPSDHRRPFPLPFPGPAGEVGGVRRPEASLDAIATDSLSSLDREVAN